MEYLLTVGQMSKIFNTTTETLRHYDRIGLLKPIVDEKNGYRYYSIKETEVLDLILDAKYLEIPLSDIKNILEEGSIESYLELIELQEKTIEEKIEHLHKIKEQAKEKKSILKEILQFKNIYEFENLKISKQDKTMIFIPIENIINNKIKQKDKSLRSLYLEKWLTIYRATDNNTLIEIEEYLGIDIDNIANIDIYNDKRNIEKRYSGNFIEVKFYGTVKSLEEYIVLLLKYFYKDNQKLDIDISIEYIWIGYKEDESEYFVKISMPI